MASQYELLGAARINTIMQGLQDIRLLPQQLRWVRRIPDTPSVDEEIMARFIGTPIIADIIADDAKAAVYPMGRFQYETTKIPNIKKGVAINQAMMNQLARLQAGYAAPGDMGIFTNWENRAVMDCMLGVSQRKEMLEIAMLSDGLSYNRLGIIMSGVTWGMPSDLKITTAVTWDTAGSATPVNDIWGAKFTASARYGVNLNRATMSTTDFRYMIATTEFQNKARLFLAPNVSFANLTLTNIQQQMTLAGNILGMELELYDARYWSQDSFGNSTSTPFHPIGKVILTDSANDGRADVYDFANGIVTESVVAGLVRTGIVGDLPPNSYGPVGYVAPTDANLNPPGLAYWGVARGFPRKKLLQSSAVLTVGTYSDTLATAVPFPA